MLSGIGLICADISSSPFFSEISGLVHHSQEISPKNLFRKPIFAQTVLRVSKLPCYVTRDRMFREALLRCKASQGQEMPQGVRRWTTGELLDRCCQAISKSRPANTGVNDYY